MLLALLLLLAAEENLKDAYSRLSAVQTSITFTTYAGGRHAHHANSHLIVTNDGVVLVDAQGTAKDAQRVVEMVKAVGAPLRYVILTSAAADQTAGLALVREAFPTAKIVSTKAIAAELKITPVTQIEIAGHTLPLIALSYGKDKACTALDVRPLKMIVGGCTVNGEHTIADLDPAQTKSAIDVLRKLQANTVLPSYGSTGPAATVLDAMAAKVLESK